MRARHTITRKEAKQLPPPTHTHITTKIKLDVTIEQLTQTNGIQREKKGHGEMGRRSKWKG